MARIGIREQEVELALPQLGRDRAPLFGDLVAELGIVLAKLCELHHVARPALELLPRGAELAILE